MDVTIRINVNNILKILAMISAVALYTYFVWIIALLNGCNGEMNIKTEKKLVMQYDQRSTHGNKLKMDLEFIPPKFDSVCENLFKNTPADAFDMSPAFKNLSPDFEAAVKASNPLNQWAEGHSADVLEEKKLIHLIAGKDFVRTICETGFNYGHSSFNYLTASSKVIVHSFDLGVHAYAGIMAKYLSEKFPGRIFVHFGDSLTTIPQFIRENPGFRCDFIFVDGGHNYPVAKADLDNFASLANPTESFVLFDDYPTDWGQAFGKAWEESCLAKKITEVMRCLLKSSTAPGVLQRGMTLGKYI